VLIPAADIGRRVDELATAIEEAYADTEMLVLVGVLKGSFIFMADLARRLSVPHRVEFIAVSSYGAIESEDPGAVRLLMDVRHDVAGQDVLIIEDIVDTGHTLSYLLRLLSARKPRSLRTCALLHKPDRTVTDVTIDYLGFTIPDVWVVGYGLDFAERHRTRPDICELPPALR
jgi:hypoxanthine phosphoribosyltransferase